MENIQNNQLDSNNTNQVTPLPTVTIAFPCRNREWILNDFLNCVTSLNYPKELITIFTIINDSTDKTKSILYDFKLKNQQFYNKITIKEVNYNTPIYDQERTGVKEITQYHYSNGQKKVKVRDDIKLVYENLGKLRNSIIHNVDTDYLLSVDSDIMFEPETLNRLLKHGKDYVSALICNGYVYAKTKNEKTNEYPRPYDYTNILYRELNVDGTLSNIYKHYKFDDERFLDSKYVNENGLIEVDNTGAIFLISKQAYKSGAKYGYHANGEDAHFSEKLKEKEFRIFCDTTLKCSHIMDEEVYDKWKSGWTY
jgi:cellulose synthase/poly-beta-1,6-N-acetylglucosamine synthase-like glycosyltransferase